MHIPDGLISGPINIAGGIAAVAAVGWCVRRASREVQQQPNTVPLLATTGAFVFAAQMLNFPIGMGTSGHFLGAAAIAALMGPWSACLVMAQVLVIQCFVFSDGGLTALGTNIFNMGVVGGFGGWVIMRALRAVLPMGRGGYLAAVAIASWVSVVLASTACALELAASGTSPLDLVLPVMIGTHAVIGVGEALITTAVLSAVIAARRDVLPDWSGIDGIPVRQFGRRAAWTVAGVGLLAALVMATLLSPLASSSPDGLEKVAQQQGFMELAQGQAVWKHAAMPDYSTPAIAGEKVSTSMAGLLGTMAIFAAGFCMVKLISARWAKQES